MPFPWRYEATPRRDVGKRAHAVSRRGAPRESLATTVTRVTATLLCFARPALCELGTAAHDLSNFQGKHACSSELRMATPETVEEVARVVSAFPKVRAVGVGHSWHKELFCAGDDSSAVDVVLSRVRSVGVFDIHARGQTSRSLKGGDRRTASRGNPSAIDARFEVDTERRVVKSDAGATVRDLLDFLRDYDEEIETRPGDATDGAKRPPRASDRNPERNANAKRSGSQSTLEVLSRLRRSASATTATGYTLPAFPWFIDQTVGGAAATATHGSSLRFGSMSSQVVGFTVVLANGTVAAFHEDDTPEHVFNALRTNVGRLGVVVDVSLRIKPNHPVRKTSFEIAPETFVQRVERASEKFAECVDRAETTDHPSPDAARKKCATASPEMRRLDETQAFWFFPLGKIVEVTFSRLDDFEADLETAAAVSRNDGDSNDSVSREAAVPEPEPFFLRARSRERHRRFGFLRDRDPARRVGASAGTRRDRPGAALRRAPRRHRALAPSREQLVREVLEQAVGIEHEEERRVGCFPSARVVLDHVRTTVRRPR